MAETETESETGAVAMTVAGFSSSRGGLLSLAGILGAAPELGEISPEGEILSMFAFGNPELRGDPFRAARGSVKFGLPR